MSAVSEMRKKLKEIIQIDPHAAMQIWKGFEEIFNDELDKELKKRLKQYDNRIRRDSRKREKL